MDRQRQDLCEVVAGLLEDPRALAALTDRDMGALFRLINHRGVSTRRIAAAVEITQGRLYDYMNNKSRVEKLAIFEQIADALHIPGRLLGLARRAWEAQVRDPQQHAVQMPAGSDDLAAMDAFRNADRQAGGGRLYGAVVQYLGRHVGPRLVDADSSPQVFAAAAALTEMAGWMAHDSGQNGLAARHFALAQPLARASGDLPLAAHIAASRSHLALQAGDASGAALWATTGLDLAGRGPLIPALVARLHTMHARAMAVASHHTPATHALDRALRVLGAPTDTEHPWLSPFDAAALAGESALILRDLKHHDQALAHAEDAVRFRADGRARSLALSRITLAGIHVHRLDLDSAVRVGHDLLSTSPTLGSVRVVHELDKLRRLIEPHKKYGPIREYLVRFDDSMRARMLLLADIIPPEGGVPS
ncbi:XRE family transcriptional regulator [Streptomyces sp. NPDC048680]|uniref:XRE family transcriptional regulator n=1 Tax=Streptomyces sp. NPDC048680 TaxID=3155492 RepID=UPI003438F979